MSFTVNWWNNVTKQVDQGSPAKMVKRHGGVIGDWIDANGNAKTNGDWNFKPTVEDACAGQQYWYWEGTTSVTLMDQAGRDAVDAARLSAFIAQAKQRLKDQYNQSVVSDKAIVLMLLDEINILRAALSELKAELKPAALNNALTYNTDSQRTPSQARTAYENKVDSF